MPKEKPTFSLAAMVAAKCTESWHTAQSIERKAVLELHEQFGTPQAGERVPPDVLSTRVLTAASTTNGAFLTSTQNVGYLEALQPLSVVLRAGATPLAMGPGSTSVPRGASAVAVSWLPSETTQTTGAVPTLGQINFQRKELSAYVEISRQLLLQSAAETILRGEMARAIAAELDKQVLGGDGLSGKPLGLANIPGTTAITGASLGYAALVGGMQAVSDNNAVADPSKLAFVAAPSVAALLKQRYRLAIYGETPLWQGSIAAGRIEDQPALASKVVPAATLIHGDFSQLLLAQWSDGITMLVDPFTKMQQLLIGVRVTISVDVAVVSPLAFAVASSVT